MGPPKTYTRQQPYSQQLKKYDCFEYRSSNSEDSAYNNEYYLFNPWTGETIFNTVVLDRNKSMWSIAEKYPSDTAVNTYLYPEFYCSRRWGRRKFNGWSTRIEAANHIQTVGRGYLARLRLKKYFRNRFYTRLDVRSGYYYFVDTKHPDDEPTWYKPRLAFPDDILPFVEDDPEDYMQGDKFSSHDHTQGPYFKISGLNKYFHKVKTLNQKSFFIENPLREIASEHYKELDLDNVELNSIIPWMEGIKVIDFEVTEFHFMRAAICDNKWDRVLHYMKNFPDNFYIQLYGFHGLAKTSVPMDMTSGVLDFASSEALELCLQVTKDDDDQYDIILKIFAFHALHNILSIRPGRLEFLNIESVPEQGEARNAAVKKYLGNRISMFTKYLRKIQNETHHVFEKGENEPRIITKPTRRSVELIELVLQCLGKIAQEQDIKEQMAMKLSKQIFFAIETCIEEPFVCIYATQLLYNFCYRCEAGQEYVLASVSTSHFLKMIDYQHSNDSEVLHYCQRLRLALRPDGWRGFVENIFDEKFKDEIMTNKNESSSTQTSKGTNNHGHGIYQISWTDEDSNSKYFKK